MRYDFDAITIGNGTAATRFAGELRKIGWSVAVIGPDPHGGTCINRGCMPTKLLVEITKHYKRLGEGLEKRGIILPQPASLDFETINRIKERDVEYFRASKLKNTLEQGVTLIDGTAHFVSGGVKVGDKIYRARRYLVATGSVPKTLPIPGLDQVDVLTSKQALEMVRPPKSLVVQGAGPIGLEFAQIFARMGSNVWLVNRSPLLSHFDEECGAELNCVLREERNLKLKIHHTIRRVEPTDDGSVLLTMEDPDGRQYAHDADQLMLAVGREPTLENLHLDKAGIVPVNGLIPVNQYLQSIDNPDVYVAGDALGQYQVLHAANQEGEIAAHNAAVRGAGRWLKGWGGLAYRSVNYGSKMQIIFTDPPFVQVGLTSSEARSQDIPIRVTGKYFKKTGRARVMGVRHGLWKLIINARNNKIMGSSILGPRAEELGHIVATLMMYGGTTADILRTPWYHPTLGEVIKDLAS